MFLVATCAQVCSLPDMHIAVVHTHPVTFMYVSVCLFCVCTIFTRLIPLEYRRVENVGGGKLWRIHK